jgi:hypothetical protein
LPSIPFHSILFFSLRNAGLAPTNEWPLKFQNMASDVDCGPSMPNRDSGFQGAGWI